MRGLIHGFDFGLYGTCWLLLEAIISEAQRIEAWLLVTTWQACSYSTSNALLADKVVAHGHITHVHMLTSVKINTW